MEIEMTRLSSMGCSHTTVPYPWINPIEDTCDCDERCSKCGKKKKGYMTIRSEHIWTR